jgi:tetratricopeptide (TPR) repeat protein
MRHRMKRRIMAWTAVFLLVAQFGCAARTVAPSPAAPAVPIAEADRRACEAYADKHPSKSVLARTLLGGLVLLPLGAGVALLGLAAGRPEGVVLPFMAFNPAIKAANENRTTREAALAACLDPAIEAQTHGPRHPRVARSLTRLAAGYAVLGDLAQAEALYQRALGIQEEALGPDHDDVALTLEGYAALLRKRDRAAEAAELEARIEAIRTKAASTWENHVAGGESAPSEAADLTDGGAPSPPSAPPE